MMKAIYTKLPRWRYAGTNTTDRYALKNVARSSVCWLSSSSSGESNNETSKASWRRSRASSTSTTRLGERMMNDTPITHPQKQSTSRKNTLRQIEESAFENMSKSLSDTMKRVVKPRASNQVQHQQRRPPPPYNRNTNYDRNYNLNYHRKNLNYLKVGANVNPHDDPQIIKALTKINNCKEIQHVLRVLKDYISDYSRDVEGSNSLVPAAWKKIQSLLKDTNNQRGGRHQQSTTSHQQQQQNTSAVRYELEELFHQTLSELHTYNPTQLSDIAQSTAYIVKHVTNRSNKSTLEGATLYNLFATKNSQTINYWNTILDLTIQEIDKYTPKQLVTISWTYATILQSGNHTNDRSLLSNVVNVTPYFVALHTSYKKRSKEFKLKHLGNILWSCMTCKVTAVPNLYTDFANEFIQRREKESKQLQKYGHRINNNNDRLDPIILCQWVNGYAKSNEIPASYEQLFDCISHVAIPMMLENKFDSRHYANFVYAYALAKFNPRYVNKNKNNSVNSNNNNDGSGNSSTPESTTLCDTVAKSIIPKLSTFTPQHLANISWSFAKMEHFTNIEMFHALSEESKHRLKEFTPQQLANLTWAFSKFPSSSNKYGDLYDYIASDIVNNRNGTSRFSSQGLAMLCTSFASVQKNDDSHTKFWNLLEKDASSERRLKQLGPIECSQISWSFATIGRSQSDQLFAGIEHIVLSKLGVGKFETLGLSNLAWSFSILGYGSSNFFTVIEKQCIDKFNECTAKDKTMLALAYSRREGDDNDNEEYPKELFDLIASSTLTNLRDYTGLDLFNIVVSFVKVGYIHHKPLMEAVANELVRRPLSEYSYQDRDVVNACVGLAWAYSTVGCRSPRLLDYIATACIDQLDTLDTKEIGSLAWSFASLECYHRPFFRALAKSSEHRWDDFDESSLAKMAWSLSTKSLNIPDSDNDDDNSHIVEKIFMSDITKAAIAKGDTFTVQAISMILWSCSARGYLHPRLFETFIPRASELLLDARGELDDIHTSNIQSLANIAWACAVQDIVDADTLFDDAFISIITWHIDDFNDEGLCQLHQWNTWRKTTGHSATLPQDIEERCRDTFINRGVRSSNLQKDVIFELSRMGLQLEEEALTSSGYRLDVLVNIDGKQIGIEMDGPTHFIGKEPTGSTILKHRQVVNSDGMHLVSIPYWEWNELKRSNDKERYLRDRLNTCGEEIVL